MGGGSSDRSDARVLHAKFSIYLGGAPLSGPTKESFVVEVIVSNVGKSRAPADQRAEHEQGHSATDSLSSRPAAGSAEGQPNDSARPWPIENIGLYRSSEVRILVLDDDSAVCRVIQAALAPNDFKIDVISDPSLIEALACSERPYHLIILDYVIPGLESEDVPHLGARSISRQSSLIVVTAYPIHRQPPLELPAKKRPHLRLPPHQAIPHRSVAEDGDALASEGRGLLRMVGSRPCASRWATPSASAAKRSA